MPGWVRIAAAADLPPGSCGEFVVGDRIVALCNVAGSWYALDGICPHQGGPLGKGFLDGCVVTCPWHGFQFDVTTGRHLTSPSVAQPTFPVQVDDDQIFVDVGET